ncbi:hypothetical protein D1007_52381 [Hordeum vulgare]|nr:hypothetical protein D1007_52381 [Hordeum vulgare]
MASIGEIYYLPESQTRDLSRCSEQELISIIRGRYRSPEKKAAFLELDERAEHWYFIKDFQAWKTSHGTWSPKKLVSIPNTSQGNSSNSPKFVGTKTTLEFKPTDGTKPTLGMAMYNILMTMKDRRGLYMDEELSLCHTYPLQRKATVTRNRNGKRPHAPDQCNGFAPPPLDDWKQELSEFDMTDSYPLDVADYGVDVPDLFSTDSSKQPRTESKHWHNFTKIYTSNPKVMYAACNHCDTMLKLKGGSNCGTSSLGHHHNDACRCKPKQDQLPGNSSSMPIPSTALQAITE